MAEDHDCREHDCHKDTPVYTDVIKAKAADGGVMDFMPFLADPTAELLAIDREERKKGLYYKYRVYKVEGDGKPIDDFFVLRPVGDIAALRALQTYARTTRNHRLAGDLMLWIDKIVEGRGDQA